MNESADPTRLSDGHPAELNELRAAGQRLSDAIADKAAVDGIAARGGAGWKEQMDADKEYIDALQALRTAIDGRPR